MSPDVPLIRLERLCKSFSLPDQERFDALREVSLVVKQGDAMGLIGRSGAGKSTLLRLINLLERPDSGRVIVAGQELTALNKAQLRAARERIGMIFQQFNLLQNATVFDNVAFPLRIHGRHSRAEIEARVRECIDVVGLAEKLDAYPAQLSGGQKQRVAIARALAPKPSVLLCDEPTSALDAETTRSVLATLKEINERLGVTIVIVTHELSVVQALCRQVAVLEQGLLVEQMDLGTDAPLTPISSLGRELKVLIEGTKAKKAAAASAAGAVGAGELDAATLSPPGTAASAPRAPATGAASAERDARQAGAASAWLAKEI
ncbi:MAG: methionine ABC transporter ATP-binding protein [Lautropia sp.]|nr:methionine ABC transporter ATP-binding protein [Lautropia sp.]